MEAIHKKVLANKTSEIMNRISNPVILAGHLRRVFSTADIEEIDAKTSQRGATTGTQTFLSLLEKRGPSAFFLFIEALRDLEINHSELADELEQEDRKLRGRAETPMRRGNSLPPSNDNENSDKTMHSPPPPYSAPPGSSHRSYFKTEEPSLMAERLPDTETNNQFPEQSSVTNNKLHEQNKITLIPGSLVKDIPYATRTKIERMMNVKCVNDHNWKGLAAAMNMTADAVRQIEEGDNGKMKGLFDTMIHTKRTIKDLLGFLKHPDVQRLDVIDEIVMGCSLPKELSESVSSELDETASMSKVPSLPYSTQESQKVQGHDAKPDARNPSQIEDNGDPKGKGSSASKPDARIPRQEECDNPNGKTSAETKPDARVPSQVEYDDDPKNRAQSDTKPDARAPSQAEDDEEPASSIGTKGASQMPHQVDNSCSVNSTNDKDDVFESTGNNEMKRNALLISCCGRGKTDKMHNSELHKLEGVLDNSWEVKYHHRCKASELLQAVHSFLDANICRQSVSFVYLTGPTVHINGENYLLPTDLKSPSSQADLMHTALNINWLVSQLRRNYMQVVIVDGAFEFDITDINLRGVLKGLAPIKPLPNAVIAFPCHPGTVRPEQERLDYIKSVLTNLDDESVMLSDLFDKVRDELRKKNPNCSLPVEFSLSSLLFPLCLNSNNNEGLHLDSLSDATCHAIIVSNFTYSELINTNQCMEDCEKLRMALLMGHWECTAEICNMTAKEIIDELGKTLNRLSADKKNKVVMVYFMGYTRMILDCNYFFGRDFTVGSPEPLRSSVPLKWVLDLMCEKLRGPKVLIVDDLGSSQPKGLVQMTAPIDVMISLPKGRGSSSRRDDTSFTTNFAKLLETNSGQRSLKKMVQNAASFDRHHLSSSLYLN